MARRLVIFLIVISNDMQIPPGYVQYPSVGAALKVRTDKRSWNAAKAACIADGARLAIIDNREKLRVVNQQKPRNMVVWVGIRKKNGSWLSADERCFCADTVNSVTHGGGYYLSPTEELRKVTEKILEPEFDLSVITNVTSPAGQTAYLTCRVKNLGNRTVSWVRHRDIHILTTGTYTYTSDQRFQAIHRPNVEVGVGPEKKVWSEWTLCVKWVQERDSGIYECQLPTTPVTSNAFRLKIVVPTAKILSGPDLYVDAGSTLNLTCVIGSSPEPPDYIFWYYNQKMLNYDIASNGKYIYTAKGNDVTTSGLLIKSADRGDSGEYSCRPSNAKKASVRVHVLNGERPEAMQTGGATVPVCHLPATVLAKGHRTFFQECPV